MKTKILLCVGISSFLLTAPGFSQDVKPVKDGHEMHAERMSHHKRHKRGQMKMRRELRMLGLADTNNDNAVTREEITALQSEEFAFRDRNGDGYLDQNDASPLRQRLHKARQADKDASRPNRRARGHRARLAKRDTDGDKRISRDEFLNMHSELFERFDSNKDNTVSADEIETVIEKRQAERKAKRAKKAWWQD